MAVYSSTGNVLSLDLVQNYAKNRVKSNLNSSFFERIPLITFLIGKAGGESPLGREGSLALLGGDGNFSKAKREDTAGEKVHVRVQKSNSTVSGFIGSFGQSPALAPGTSQAHDVTTASFAWSEPFASAIKVPGIVIRTSEGARIASAVDDAVDLAMHDHLDQLRYHLWRGNPSSQSADEWSSYLGILQAIDIDNTYGNIARSGATHYWSGNRVTTAVSATLNLIDHAQHGVESCSSIGYPLNRYGMGANLWFAAPGVYYKLKQEALARGQTVMIGDMPEALKVGAKVECIKYGKAVIIEEPAFSGDWSSYDSDVTDASKLLVGLTTKDWYFGVNRSHNFSVGKMTYQFDQRPGGEDALTATLTSQGRLWCEKPHRNIVFTNVS